MAYKLKGFMLSCRCLQVGCPICPGSELPRLLLPVPGRRALPLERYPGLEIVTICRRWSDQGGQCLAY